MSIHEYICQCGHTTEAIQKIHTDQYMCEICGKWADYKPSVNASMPGNWSK